MASSFVSRSSRSTKRRAVSSGSAEGGRSTHYNAAVQALAHPGGAKIAWTADFLPDPLDEEIARAMDMGMAAMKATLDRLAE